MPDKLQDADPARHEPEVAIRLVRSEIARILAEAGGLADIEQDMISMSPPQTPDEYIGRQLQPIYGQSRSGLV